METKIEDGVYLNYAFNEDEDICAEKNNEKRKELIAKHPYHIVPYGYETNLEHEPYDVIMTNESLYGRNVYTVLKNKANLSMAQLALIAGGSLICFGYHKINSTRFSINNGS